MSPKSEPVWELYKLAEKDVRADNPSDAMETEEEQTDNDLSTRLSTEDLADDEREDSTDSEQEVVHKKGENPSPVQDLKTNLDPDKPQPELDPELDSEPEPDYDFPAAPEGENMVTVLFCVYLFRFRFTWLWVVASEYNHLIHFMK